MRWVSDKCDDDGRVDIEITEYLYVCKYGMGHGTSCKGR